MKIELNTKHATRKILAIQKNREEKLHTLNTLIETGKQTRNVREGAQGYYW